jgi:hypothetical protein
MILDPNSPRAKAQVDHVRPVLCAEGVAEISRLSGTMIFLNPLQSPVENPIENRRLMETVEAISYCVDDLALSLIFLETPSDLGLLLGRGFLLGPAVLNRVCC